MADMKYAISIRDLESAFYNQSLNELIKGIDTDNLLSLKARIFCDDIVGVRPYILQKIEDEIELRFLEDMVPSKDAEFISSVFDLNLNTDNIENIRNSYHFFVDHQLSTEVIRWCPSLLFVERIYKVYKFLKSEGRTEEQIIEFVIGSFDKTMSLSNALLISKAVPTYPDDFVEFFRKTSNTIESRMTNTESYRKLTQKMINDNAELLKRLS